jgi:hypothetical protein
MESILTNKLLRFNYRNNIKLLKKKSILKHVYKGVIISFISNSVSTSNHLLIYSASVFPIKHDENIIMIIFAVFHRV